MYVTVFDAAVRSCVTEKIPLVQFEAVFLHLGMLLQVYQASPVLDIF